ncbi:glycine cleavage system aminomethyltransferase GcvT [Panacagrimonas sp.]|uniref:glycine cleavage system aminomethyltransferase GcvT n=1 Tax=Panacagrimonas sp. TaxID=2480088 RepID=UPI003B5293E1
MRKRTVLFESHQHLGARLVDFAGWEMPIQYTSQLDEHHAVRSGAGIFDVSHMCAVDLRGPRVRAFLSRVLANDVAKLQVPDAALPANPGKGMYSCLLREDGGVLDDLIVYLRNENFFRLVVNAGTADKDIEWLRRHARIHGVDVLPRRDLGILAVQGPQARQRVHNVLPRALAEAAAQLKAFNACEDDGVFVARTGYTGEDGYEIVAPQVQTLALWTALLKQGVTPCGLGARDTLRLEAGMNLYGQDMDETVTPLESGLAWTVAMSGERDFIGRIALERQAQQAHRQQVGLIFEGRGVLRAHMPVRFADGAQGEITSGGFAPTLKRSIALARVEPTTLPRCEVELRGVWQPARLFKPPFVRHGKSLIPDDSGAG